MDLTSHTHTLHQNLKEVVDQLEAEESALLTAAEDEARIQKLLDSLDQKVVYVRAHALGESNTIGLPYYHPTTSCDRAFQELSSTIVVNCTTVVQS